MGDLLAARAALNLSIAARAYWVALQALNIGAAAPDAPIARHKAEVAHQEMDQARAAIERLMADIGLAWQIIPVDRLLRTQVGLLRDALYYASPEALQGFGALQPATADFLASWREVVLTVITALARAVEGESTTVETSAWAAAANGDLGADALSQYQRPALNGFAHAFAADLLLAEALSQAAWPPSHPTFTSPYDAPAVAQMLAITRILDGQLAAFVSALSLSTRRGAAAATIVQRSLRHAQDCLAQVSNEAGDLGDARAPMFAGLSVTAGHNLLLALNLT